MKFGRGHWCWSCQQTKPNEAFSGRNHGRHLCRMCASHRRRAAREERKMAIAAGPVAMEAHPAVTGHDANRPVFAVTGGSAWVDPGDGRTTTHQLCCQISSRRRSCCPTMTGPFWPNTLLRAYRRNRNGSRNWNVGHAEPSPIPSAETHGRWWRTGWQGASHADEETACVCAVSRRCRYTSIIRIWPTIALAEAFATFEKPFCERPESNRHPVKDRNLNPVDCE